MDVQKQSNMSANQEKKDEKTDSDTLSSHDAVWRPPGKSTFAPPGTSQETARSSQNELPIPNDALDRTVYQNWDSNEEGIGGSSENWQPSQKNYTQTLNDANEHQKLNQKESEFEEKRDSTLITNPVSETESASYSTPEKSNRAKEFQTLNLSSNLGSDFCESRNPGLENTKSPYSGFPTQHDIHTPSSLPSIHQTIIITNENIVSQLPSLEMLGVLYTTSHRSNPSTFPGMESQTGLNSTDEHTSVTITSPTPEKTKTKGSECCSNAQVENKPNETKLCMSSKNINALFLCVSNLNPSTSDNTLTEFLKSCSCVANVEVVNLVYSEDGTISVAQFSLPVDDRRIQNNCKDIELEGKFIAVNRIDQLKYIIVSADNDIAEETLKKYFQSQGGEVLRVLIRHDGSFKVKFKYEEDVMRVCSRATHEVANTSLIVTPMFCTDEAETGIYDVSKHTVSLPSSLVISDMNDYFQTFLKQSKKVIEQVNTRLKEKFAKVVISEETRLECLLSQKTPKVRKIVKVWDSEAKKLFYECINEMLHTSEIIVAGDAWNEVENAIIQQKMDTDTILTIYEKVTLKIIFVGEMMSVKTIHSEISKMHEVIQNYIQRKKRFETKEMHFTYPMIRLLKRTDIFEEMNMVSDDLKVDLNHQNRTIKFTGVGEDIVQAQSKIAQKVNKFEIWIVSENISKFQVRLMKRNSVKCQLESKFMENNLIVEMEFGDDAMKVFALDKHQHLQTNLIIETLTTESEINLDEMSANVLSTNEWKLEKEAVCRENKDQVSINTIDGAKIVITSTSDMHDDIKGRIEKFIQENSIYSDVLAIPDNGIFKFVSKHCVGDLEGIAKKNKQYFLTVNLQDNTIVISGTKKGLTIGKQETEAMIQLVGSDEKIYSQPGLCKILRNDEAKLTEIENTCRSIIMFQDSQVNGPQHSMKISLLEGDLGKQEGDVIVCSVSSDLDLTRGRSSSSVLDTGGYGLMEEIITMHSNGVEHGEVAIISGGDLKCKELFLGCLPPWNDDNGKVLIEFMTTCLDTANVSSYKSIVFPAMGTGHLGYPRDRVAAIMYQTVINHFKGNDGTKVEEVKFVCFNSDSNTIKAFEEEKTRHFIPHPLRSTETEDDLIIIRKKMKISIVKNEIGKHSADVVVVTCEKSLDLNKSGKAAKSVYAIGGEVLTKEVKVKYPNGIKNFGDFASITAVKSNLNCQDVYLTSIPATEKKSQSTLCRFVSECMKEADKAGHKSIGFVAMGTGVMAYPPALVAKNMYRKVIEYVTTNHDCNVQHVHFVLYPEDKTTIQAFEECEKELITFKSNASELGTKTGPFVTKNKMQISMEEGDIANHIADVLVVVCKKSLDLNKSGKSVYSLYECGGTSLQRTVKMKYPKGIASFGDFASIPVEGNLNCKEVYLTSLPTSSSERKSQNVLCGFVTECMQKADQSGHVSIAFGALGTGDMKYPETLVARNMYDQVIEYSNSNPNCKVRYVQFVLCPGDKNTLQAFEDYEKKLLTDTSYSSYSDFSLSVDGELTVWKGYASSAVAQSMTVKIYGDCQQNRQDTDREIIRLIQSQCTKAETNYPDSNQSVGQGWAMFE